MGVPEQKKSGGLSLQIRVVTKDEKRVTAEDAAYQARRNAIALMRSLRSMYPEDYAKIARETGGR